MVCPRRDRLPEVEVDRPAKKTIRARPFGSFQVDNAQVLTAEGKVCPCVSLLSNGARTSGKWPPQRFKAPLFRPPSHRIHIVPPPLSDCQQSPVGQRVERMYHSINDVTVKRFHYDHPFRKPMANVISAYNLRAKAKGPQRPSTLRVALKAMGTRAEKFHPSSDPSNVGTKQLAYSLNCTKTFKVNSRTVFAALGLTDGCKSAGQVSDAVALKSPVTSAPTCFKSRHAGQTSPSNLLLAAHRYG